MAATTTNRQCFLVTLAVDDMIGPDEAARAMRRVLVGAFQVPIDVLPAGEEALNTKRVGPPASDFAPGLALADLAVAFVRDIESIPIASRKPESAAIAATLRSFLDRSGFGSRL